MPDPLVTVLASKPSVSARQENSLARRRWQEGTITYRNGRCYGRYRRDVVDASGKVMRKAVWVPLGLQKDMPTERLARKHLAPYLATINSFSYRPERICTLSEFVEVWKREVLSKQKPSTVRSANSHLRKYIVPILGSLRLEEVGTENQQRFISSLGISRKSVQNVLVTLAGILTTAQNWGYAAQEVNMKRLRLPQRGMKKERPYFTVEQIASILSMAEEPWKTMFMAFGLTGMRAGEVLGLQPQDFDFKAETVTIRRTAWYGHAQTAKTPGSETVLPLPKMLADAIQIHIQKARIANGAFLFVTGNNRPPSSNNVVAYRLKPILRALGIDQHGAGLHAFRHGMATMLKDDKVHLAVVQAQLRHSKSSTTMLYTHTRLDEQREVVDNVAEKVRASWETLAEKGQYLQ